MRDGLLLLDKDPGGTSHDVVQRVRRLLRQKKVGHCGTLDPDATGLLLLTLGRATRLTRFLIRAPKVYEGVIRLGVATDTYDAAGEVVSRQPTEGVTEEAVRSVMAGLQGRREQAVPPYCAKKTHGERYYELARRGEETPDVTKTVEIFELAMIGPLDEDRVPFVLRCSSGTYARALAHELGQKLGCGGHLESLRRLQIGPFQVEHAIRLAELERRLAAGEQLGGAWVPFDSIPLPFGQVRTDAQQERRVVHGQAVLVQQVEGDEGDWIKILNARDRLIAVGTVSERIGEGKVAVVQPRVVFH